MLRQAYCGALLVLEGKDDVLFWGNRHRHHPCCRLVRGDGRDNVVSGVLRLDARSTTGVLGMIDSDYDSVMGTDLPSENLVATDAHDLECVLCRSPALDHLLDEHGDADKIRRFEQESGVTVRQALLDRAVVFGSIRLAARVWKDSKLRGRIHIPEFLREETWEIDEDRLLDAVADRSTQSRETWESRLAETSDADPWYVSVGHDMIEILRIGLQSVLGNMPSTIGVKGVASGLRMAMSREFLEATGLWEDVRAWESLNQPFAVLPE